jgi:hypothetical protein
MSADFNIHWIDRGQSPTQQPNPAYPLGIDIDLTSGRPGCKDALPWPAPRIGFFYVQCRRCGASAMITTAGRPDDPRSIKLPCEHHRPLYDVEQSS